MNAHNTRHTQVYTLLMCFTAYGMANLNVLMSIGTILLLAYWFVHPGVKKGWKRLRANKPALGMIGLYVIHLIWLFNTQNYDYAFKDLRIKLPLLVLALVLGSMHFRTKQLSYLFIALGVGIWAASVKAYLNYWNAPEGFLDFRDYVTGISHIRLSLLMVLTIAAILYYWKSMPGWLRVLSVATAVNIVVFFDLIQSASGSIILLILLLYTAFYSARNRMGTRGITMVAVAFMLVVVAAGFGLKAYYEHYFTSEESLDDLPDTTAHGGQYAHFTSNRQVENGHYTFLYICEGEMIEAWEERSAYPMRGEENLMHRAALGRYLTSKGLRKDRDGVMALNEEDVKNIEMGFPSIIYAEKKGLALRLHTTVFGYHQFRVAGNVGGSSFFQRLVYWEAAWNLIGQYGWLGTGTGDVKEAFEIHYIENNVNLEPRYRLRAHNQYLTFWVSFGILGFLTFIMLPVLPFFQGKPNYLYLAFLIIAFLSCLTEDTLETQAGVTFFAFFYALFSSAGFRVKPLTSPES